MGLRAQKYVKENFKQDKVIELTLETYFQAANGN
jgi:hypothetical protein